MVYNMKHIGDFIFKYKDEYKKLTNIDKENFFFIMNRKFARKYPKQAQFLNNKVMDKSSSMDIWFDFFIKNKIFDYPSWYWFKLSKKKNKKEIKTEDEEIIKNFYNLTEDDIEFLLLHYPDELNEEIKKFKKFKK